MKPPINIRKKEEGIADSDPYRSENIGANGTIQSARVRSESHYLPGFENKYGF